MEADSGAKISIRGRGSVKEGKQRGDSGLAIGDEEEMHALITADTEEKLKNAVRTIENILDQVRVSKNPLTPRRLVFRKVNLSSKKCNCVN